MDKYLTVRLYHDPPLADVQAVIAQAQAAGATGIALVDHHYVQCAAGSPNMVPSPWGWIFADTGPEQAPGFVGNTTPFPTVGAIAEAVHAARRPRLQLLVKPHIDIKWRQPDGSYGSGGWRGYAEPPDDPAIWQEAYCAFLRPYAVLARHLRATLCLGCEFYRVTCRYGAAWLIDLAAWVRRTCRFSGPLTYAANWGWGSDAEVLRLEALWPHLNWVGLNAYYPLAEAPTTDPEVLAAGWRRVKTDLAPLVGRPLLVTEVGYANWSLCAVEPWNVGAARDDAAQAACWRAFRAAWPGVPFAAWEGSIPGLPDPEVSHNVLRSSELAALVFGP